MSPTHVYSTCQLVLGCAQPHLAFRWVLGTRTQVLKAVQQVLYQLSNLPNPSSYISQTRDSQSQEQWRSLGDAEMPESRPHTASPFSRLCL